jgi:outer membrane protein assembly factor BamB
MLARSWLLVVFAGAALVSLTGADWPQWGGINRDNKVSDFAVPETWPAELKQQWKVPVGDGVATPALVGNKLYVFTREGANEVVRCLDAETGKELWKDEYESEGADGPARGFAGPRSTPAVADGKVVTFGARGILNCYEAETGKKLWTKQESQSVPMFYVSSSPMIVDGLVIAQTGGQNDGSVVAYDLNSGERKWKWTGAPTSYASVMLMEVDGKKLAIGQVSDGIVAIDIADGKHVWETYFGSGGSRYKAATPVIDGDKLIFADGLPTAIKISKEGDKLVEKELWKNDSSRVEYATPVLKDGNLYGLTRESQLYCVKPDGKTAWSAPAPQATPGQGAAPGVGQGGRRGGRGGGQGGYGTIVDAGKVLIGLTPTAQLVVYEPNDTEFKQLATYKVAETPTYAFPIVTDKRIFVKDQDSLTLWTLE